MGGTVQPTGAPAGPKCSMPLGSLVRIPTALSGALKARVWKAAKAKVTLVLTGTERDVGPKSAMTLSDLVSKDLTATAVLVVAVTWAACASGVIRATTSANCWLPAAVTWGGVATLVLDGATVMLAVMPPRCTRQMML